MAKHGYRGDRRDGRVERGGRDRKDGNEGWG